DNRHGVFTKELAGAMVYMFGKIETYVDCQVSQKSGTHEWFKTASYFLVNDKELNTLSDSTNMSLRIRRAEDILEGKIILKLGALGAHAGGMLYKAPQVNAVDTCGAGDAFLAALVARRDIMAAN